MPVDDVHDTGRTCTDKVRKRTDFELPLIPLNTQLELLAVDIVGLRMRT
jgi:hypothetical protein